MGNLEHGHPRQERPSFFTALERGEPRPGSVSQVLHDVTLAYRKAARDRAWSSNPSERAVADADHDRFMTQQVILKTVIDDRQHELMMAAGEQPIDRGLTGSAKIQRYHEEAEHMSPAEARERLDNWLATAKGLHEDLAETAIYVRDLQDRLLREEQSQQK